jgi:hypothetical protein
MEQLRFGSIAKNARISTEGGYPAQMILIDFLRQNGCENKNDLGLNAFAYLFQRFGAPIRKVGSVFTEKDKHRNNCLAAYWLSTSHKDVAIILYVGTNIEIEVITENEISEKVITFMIQPYIDWKVPLLKYCAEEHNTAVYMEGDLQAANSNLPNKELAEHYKECFKNDMKKYVELCNSLDVNSIDSMKDFMTWKIQQNRSLIQAFSEILPYPETASAKDYLMGLYLRFSENPTHVASEVDNAVIEALNELLQPTIIGGVLCNILGVIENTENVDIETAKRNIFKHAGSGFLEPLLENFEGFQENVILAASAGNGNFEVGFNKIMLPYKNAESLRKRNGKDLNRKSRRK